MFFTEKLLKEDEQNLQEKIDHGQLMKKNEEKNNGNIFRIEIIHIFLEVIE